MPTDETSKFDAALLRQLAVSASVDPRTVAKALRGERVRGMAGRRVNRALAAAGLLPASPSPDSTLPGAPAR